MSKSLEDTQPDHGRPIERPIHVVETLSLLMLEALDQREQGHRLYQDDNPLRRTLGFRTETESWVIKLTDVKNSLQEIEPEALRTLVLRQMQTPEGRQVLFHCDEDVDVEDVEDVDVEDIKPFRAGPLTEGLLADAFAKVETRDLRVSRVVGHPDDWQTKGLIEMLKTGTAWGAELDVSFKQDPGKVLLFSDSSDSSDSSDEPELVVSLSEGDPGDN